jgi:hypothetical protein
VNLSGAHSHGRISRVYLHALAGRRRGPFPERERTSLVLTPLQTRSILTGTVAVSLALVAWLLPLLTLRLP